MNISTLSKFLAATAIQVCDQQINKYITTEATLSQTEAYRLYGRENVDRWITEGLICPQKNKKSKILDRRQLAAIAHASNRTTYLPVADRH